MTDQLKRAITDAKTAQNHAAKTEQAEAIKVASSSAGEQQFDMSESSYKTSHTAVRKARRFAMQGLYEWLVTDRRFDTSGKLGWKDNAPHDIAARTRATNAMHTVHIGYYHEMMRDIPEQIETLDALISQHLDRDIDKLDTVEHAILLIGAYELQNRLEIPYKVVMDEAMKLNNHFGATDAHKLINAVLDRMAIELRAAEVEADTKANKRNSQRPIAPVIAVQNETDVNSEANTEQKEASETLSASTKPRISANKAGVKRNRPTKVSAGTSTAKAAIANSVKAKKDALEPVDVAAKTDNTVVIDETVSHENTATLDNNLSIASIVGASVTESVAEAQDNILNSDTDSDDLENTDLKSETLESNSVNNNNADTDATEIDNAADNSITSKDND